MSTIYCVIAENRMMENISCWGAATTRELAEELAKRYSWGFDRYAINEVELVATATELPVEQSPKITKQLGA